MNCWKTPRLGLRRPEISQRRIASSMTKSRQKLFHQQDLIGLPRRLEHNRFATADLGTPMSVRAFNKTGVGPSTFIDSGLFETDSGRWIAAAMASDIPARTTRPSDPVPVAFGDIGHALYQAWGRRSWGD